MCSPLGKILFFPFMTYWGKVETCVDSTHKEVSSACLGKRQFFTTFEGVVLVLWTHEGVLHDTVHFITPWGFG